MRIIMVCVCVCMQPVQGTHMNMNLSVSARRMHSLTAWSHLFTLFYIISMNSLRCATSLPKQKSTNIQTHIHIYIHVCMKILAYIPMLHPRYVDMYDKSLCMVMPRHRPELTHELCHQHKQQRQR